jgi:hypothetical protein
MNDHNRIIAHAAKAALHPLGYVRKGRSRLWLKDHGFWLSVVEFQPSGFERGSYLNVAAHWLWGLTDALSFDWLMQDTRTFIRFEAEAQFSASAAEQAGQAAMVAGELDSGFASLAQITEKLVVRANEGRNGWAAFHAGIASGLNGDAAPARAFFDQTLDSFKDWRSDFDEAICTLKEELDEPHEFRRMIESRVRANRAANRLAPALHPLPATSLRTP